MNRPMEVCRLCLKESNDTVNDAEVDLKTEPTIQTMTILNENYELLDFIQRTTALRVAETLYEPIQYLCHQCELIVKQFVNFQEQCTTNDGIFRSLYLTGGNSAMDLNIEIKAEPVDFDFSGESNLSNTDKPQESPDNVSGSEVADTKWEAELEFPSAEHDEMLPEDKEPEWYGASASVRNSPSQIVPRTNGRSTLLAKKKAEPPIRAEAVRCSTCRKKLKSTKMVPRPNRNHNGKQTLYDCSGCATDRKRLNGRIYACEICEKTFDFKRVYRQHMQHHAVEKKHVCQHCGKKFTHKNLLITHIRVHTGEKPYHCEICNKRFKQLGVLNVHRLVHTGEKPFECTVCGNRYRQKNSRDMHLRTHGRHYGYTCQVCKKTFTDMKDLKKHFKRHK